MTEPLGLSDRHLRELGWVVVSFGLLEEQVFAALLDRHSVSGKEANVRLGGLKFSQMLHRLDDLAPRKAQDKEGAARFRAWFEEAKKAGDYRNELVHGSWLGMQPDEALVRFNTTQKPIDDNIIVSPTSADDLHQFAERIQVLTVNLWRLLPSLKQAPLTPLDVTDGDNDGAVEGTLATDQDA